MPPRRCSSSERGMVLARRSASASIFCAREYASEKTSSKDSLKSFFAWTSSRIILFGSSRRFPFSSRLCAEKLLITREQKESIVEIYADGRAAICSLKYFRVSLSLASASFSRSFFSSLALMLAAAALVKVMTRTFSTESSRSRILLTILSVITVVFPEPAAALTRIFPQGASTIRCCSLLSPMITPPSF